MVRDHAGLD